MSKTKVSPQFMKQLYLAAIEEIKIGNHPPTSSMIAIIEQAIALLDNDIRKTELLHVTVAMLELATTIIEDLNKGKDTPVDDKFTAQAASVIAKAKG